MKSRVSFLDMAAGANFGLALGEVMHGYALWTFLWLVIGTAFAIAAERADTPLPAPPKPDGNPSLSEDG